MFFIIYKILNFNVMLDQNMFLFYSVSWVKKMDWNNWRFGVYLKRLLLLCCKPTSIP